MLKNVVKRPFITVGFLAFLMLLPLALTSNPTARRQALEMTTSQHFSDRDARDIAFLVDARWQAQLRKTDPGWGDH